MTNQTFPAEASGRLVTWLETHELSKGLGTEERACSLAAINLALTGELTDEIPDCMSEVIGEWIIRIQDAMPSSIRNSAEWKSLLPLAAGTGRKHEAERLAIIMEWLWGTALPTLQPFADEYGFGPEWLHMCTERTVAAADAAYAAAYAAARDAAYAAAYAAASTAAFATYAAAYAADTANAYATAYAAHDAARSVGPDAWQALDPCALLRRLIEA